MSSWSGGSFLAAVTSSSEDDTGRICVLDDEEQTDEHLEDVSPVMIPAKVSVT